MTTAPPPAQVDSSWRLSSSPFTLQQCLFCSTVEQLFHHQKQMSVWRQKVVIYVTKICDIYKNTCNYDVMVLWQKVVILCQKLCFYDKKLWFYDRNLWLYDKKSWFYNKKMWLHDRKSWICEVAILQNCYFVILWFSRARYFIKTVVVLHQNVYKCF